MIDVETLIARESIRDALARYCRGIDRSDSATVAAVFHEGAPCHYGNMETTGDALARMIAGRPGTTDFTGQHHITNVLIDMDGAEAAQVESYFIVYRAVAGSNGAADTMIPFGGRYLDRFTRVGGAWRIAERTVVCDWLSTGLALAGGADPSGYLRGTNGSDDPSHAFRIN
ncbi:nuclear transport factor 2 family protein [Sphingomonas sp. AOB5]|uniref:nuclear transport factor 2 family protein n=1 Tax=Sphingomonas sp. AOB5 TaxID=3034017 RepID=UPI0023F8A93D|nr:nuclear transport factor 2 family protein [Sphingomonas sp. AOB5]MDF7774847.1 nuclear transport factor 2 family protein [Sphingomonas sp. AOB5]